MDTFHFIMLWLIWVALGAVAIKYSLHGFPLAVVIIAMSIIAILLFKLFFTIYLGSTVLLYIFLIVLGVAVGILVILVKVRLW